MVLPPEPVLMVRPEATATVVTVSAPLSAVALRLARRPSTVIGLGADQDQLAVVGERGGVDGDGCRAPPAVIAGEWWWRCPVLTTRSPARAPRRGRPARGSRPLTVTSCCAAQRQGVVVEQRGGVDGDGVGAVGGGDRGVIGAGGDGVDAVGGAG